jgi:polyhydroxyalkanoate synthase
MNEPQSYFIATETVRALPAVERASVAAEPRPRLPSPSPATELPSFETINRVGRSMMARLTGGISPHAEGAAWFDWISHFSRAPGRQLELMMLGAILGARLATLGRGNAAYLLDPERTDHRFDSPAWQRIPFLWWQQAFLAQEEWWHAATQPLRGMRARDAERVSFMVR